MKRKVIIEQWRADTDNIHVREPDSTRIHCKEGSVTNETTVAKVVEVGQISGLLVSKLSKEYWLEGSCYEFCDMVDDVLSLGKKQIDEARGFIEDCVDSDEQPKFSDVEVSWLDYELRSRVAEQGKDCDNPFADKIVLKRHEPFEFITKYCKRRGDYEDER